jgi:putative transposase
MYSRRVRPQSQRDKDTTALDVEIMAIHKESRGRYGSPRIFHELRRRGRRVGRKRVEKRMRQHAIFGRKPRRFRRTTKADINHKPAPNLLDRRFHWPMPDQAWVGDITYVWTVEGWIYLAILVDLCTREIVGWATSRHCDTALALACLEKAIKRHSPDGEVLIHHDRGSTYTAKEYQDVIKKMSGISSMSRKGNCWDNSVSESTFSTIKTELFSNRIPEGLDQANRELFEYIEAFYNRKRLHSSLGYITPVEKEALARKTLLAA